MLRTVAAVADYRVKNPSKQKIKKANGHLSLELEENPDILAWVAALPKPPFCVGFAAESENLGRNAYRDANQNEEQYRQVGFEVHQELL